MLSTQLYAKYYNTDPATGQRFNLMYDYDGFGNLVERYKSFAQGVGGTVTETMSYDNLHRLTTATVAGSVTTSKSYLYDSLGNMINKSDFASNYIYGAGSAGPNAVTSVYKNAVGTINYNYDAAGNLLNGDGKTLTYNSFNKPVTISENGTQLNFNYGPDLARYKQVKTNGSGKVVTTIYLGKLFERVTTSVTGLPDKIEEKSYLSDKVIVNEVKKGDDLPYYRLSFLHKDRLGSIISVTSEQAIEKEWHAFDAFGSPMQGNLSSSGGLLKTTSTVYGLDTSDEEYATSRGFTGHEHLDDVKLIHMNGRVYDPGMGRFLSVDPVIQSAGNSQSLNPYSYIMNNPLAGTDPTGYTACGEGPQSCEGEFSPAFNFDTDKPKRDPNSVCNGRTTCKIIDYGKMRKDAAKQDQKDTAKTGSQAKRAPQNEGNTTTSDLDESTTKDVIQRILTKEEKEERLKLKSKFELRIVNYSANSLEDYDIQKIIKTYEGLIEELLLTDEGFKIISESEGIELTLVYGSDVATNSSSARGKMQINLRTQPEHISKKLWRYSKDFDGGYVFIGGLRAFAHEVIHAVLDNGVQTAQNERQAMRRTNIIMKQARGSLAGERKNYSAELHYQLPKNAIIRQ